jgi:hypothetical protein
MRCHICNAPLETPIYSRRYKSFEPCSDCKEVIDTVFEDEPEEEEYREGFFEEEFSNDNNDIEYCS